MSMFIVERKKIIKITEEMIGDIQRRRQQYYEMGIADTLKEHKNKKTLFFFKKKPMSRKEAETKLWQSWNILTDFRPLWISYGKEREERASKLLNACKITTEKVIPLDVDDASFLNEWQKK